MTLKEMAELLNLDLSTISRAMRRDGIPRRKSRQFDRRADCIVEGCGEPVCKIKTWRRAKDGKVVVRWHWTIRCARHHHETKRRHDRRQWRKRRGLSGAGNERRGWAKKLGRSALIAKVPG